MKCNQHVHETPSSTALTTGSSAADAKLKEMVERPFTPSEQEHFREQFYTHYEWAFAKARQMGASDPEFTVSKAMHKAMLRFDPQRGQFKNLLFTILRWDIASEYRRRVTRTTEPLPEFIEIPDEPSERGQRGTELREIIRIAVSRLSVRDQLLFKMFYEEQHSIDEIAATGI